MKRTTAAAALTLSTALAAAVWGVTAPGAIAATTGHHPSSRTSAVARGGVGSWTRISQTEVDSIFQATTVRTSDGVLHVVYPRKTTNGSVTLAHTALSSNGAIVRQNDLLAAGWSIMDSTPVVVDGASGMHTLFGGQHDLASGYFDDGRMYMADATSDTGAAWTLPQQAVGLSHSAYGSYGTGAVELADGTPVAAYVLNNDLVWHVGTSEVTPDQTYHSSKCCLYDATLVRDGGNVWAGWYQNGSTTSTAGFFAMQIYPSRGPVLKAPGSSVGTDPLPWTTRTAMASRVGGGVYLAYCVGYPTCDYVRVWKVGTSATAKVPRSKNATAISLSPGPSGRLWVAWVDTIPKVRAVRTGRTGLRMGAVRTAGLPAGQDSAYSVVVNGTRGRGDLVVNAGVLATNRYAFWHTQVLPGLTLHASPQKWRHGSRQKVVFTVTDAHAAVTSARVKVGTASCKTGSAGTCAITFPASFARGRHTARATRAGYAAATVVLRVG